MNQNTYSAYSFGPQSTYNQQNVGSNFEPYVPYSENNQKKPTAVDTSIPVAVDIQYPTVSQPIQYAIPVARPVDSMHTKLIDPNDNISRNSAVLLKNPTMIICPHCHSTVKTQLSSPCWVFLFPFVFILFFASIVLIAVLGDPVYIAVYAPVGFIIIGLGFAYILSKSQKAKHTCPMCLNTIGKTGDTITWYFLF